MPHVPVRQWVLSLPIPLRLLLAAQPKLVAPVLQVLHRVITRILCSHVIVIVIVTGGGVPPTLASSSQPATVPAVRAQAPRRWARRR